MSSTFMERLADAAIEKGLADVIYGHADTSLGRLFVARTEKGICRIGFPQEDESLVLEGLAGLSARVIASDRALSEERSLLAAYIEGEEVDLGVPVDLSLIRSSFHRQILTTLRRDVPRGKVMTYGELALRVGHPRAARAAGSACARNPIPILLPCHRVVPAGGTLGNYGGEIWRKRYLLDIEGVQVGRAGR